MIEDFHAKSHNWSYNDTTTAEGAQLDYLTSLYGLKQVITESTHIWNSSSGCIDFIFSNQTNVITDSGVDRALDSKCHRQSIQNLCQKLNILHLTLVKFGFTEDLRQT